MVPGTDHAEPVNPRPSRLMSMRSRKSTDVDEFAVSSPLKRISASKVDDTQKPASPKNAGEDTVREDSTEYVERGIFLLANSFSAQLAHICIIRLDVNNREASSTLTVQEAWLVEGDGGHEPQRPEGGRHDVRPRQAPPDRDRLASLEAQLQRPLETVTRGRVQLQVAPAAS